MTSSGTYNFQISNAEAVISAFERVQIRAPSIRQEHMRTARYEMNALFSEWANRGINLWKIELISLTLVDGTATYDVPSRVVMIVDAYLTLNNGDTDQTDRYLTSISRTDYASYANKFTAGAPTTYWFNRLIEPELTIWPVVDSDDYVLNYYAWSRMEDAALSSGQTPDIPYLWTDAFVAGLAHRLSRVYAPQFEAQRKSDAESAWNIAAAQNIENAPVKFSLSMSSYVR